MHGIVSLLCDLNVHIACGPDGIYRRLLKETSHNIASMLIILYAASFKQHKVPSDYCTSCPMQSLRKVTIHVHLTTTLYLTDMYPL